MPQAEPRWLHQPPLPQHDIQSGRVILRDGSVAELRAAADDDRDRLIEFLEGLSPEASQHRFFGSTKPAVAADRMLSQAAPGEHVVLLVLTGDPERPSVIAAGEYNREAPESDTAEVAFLVADEYQGKGLGTLLLERLALIAARHGISSFHAFTTARNRRMLDVFRDSGFSVHEATQDGDVEVRFSIVPSEESVAKAELRERVATIASLAAFFRPRSVAVIGASRNPESIGHRILKNLADAPFRGGVFPVNPKADEIAGIKAYASLADVPAAVDLAVVAVPSQAALNVVEECGDKGVRGLVVITAGFAEIGEQGRQLQDRLLATARGYGMRLVGPNCLGLLNADPEVRLNASFAPAFPPYGPVAMSSQSGALGLAVLEYATEIDLGVSSFVSLGNKADVSSNDLLQYWEDDPNTRLILLYLESFGNPRRFARLARRAGRNKPILAVKAGRSTAGSRAAGSHTAALAASDVAVNALFEQTGVIRAGTLEELFDIASLLAHQPLPQGPRVAVISNAGGPAILATDALEVGGMQLPDPTERTQAELRSFLPETASVANPIDMIASAEPEDFRRTTEAILNDESFDAAMVLYVSLGPGLTEKVGAAVCQAVAAHRAAGGSKPVSACFMSSGDVCPPLAAGRERIPSFRFPESAARALERAYRYAKWRQTPLGHVPDHPDVDIDRAKAACTAARERGGGWLSADQVAEVLTAFGLPLATGKSAKDVDEAVQAASAIGYPVALKLASRTLIHKAEWDGVQLDLKDDAEVRDACRRIHDRLEAAGRSHELEGFLVQPMVTGDVELMVGTTHDPLFGPLVTFGLGGIHVEILRDVVFRITPLTDRDAREMVRSIRGFRLLEGYRGHPAADLEAIEDLLLRVSRLVEELPEIAELDLNPFKAFEPGRGCTILDARIRVGG